MNIYRYAYIFKFYIYNLPEFARGVVWSSTSIRRWAGLYQKIIINKLYNNNINNYFYLSFYFDFDFATCSLKLFNILVTFVNTAVGVLGTTSSPINNKKIMFQ